MFPVTLDSQSFFGGVLMIFFFVCKYFKDLKNANKELSDCVMMNIM